MILLFIVTFWLLGDNSHAISIPHDVGRPEVNRTTPSLVGRWNIPYNGPFGNWFAIGDSFSAGPGAGDRIDNDDKCKRSSGAYPEALQDNWPNTGIHDITFLSCTGAKIPDTQQNQLPDVNLLGAYATLSISGNDIGFSKILIACIAGLFGDCDDKIAAARQALYVTTDVASGYDALVTGILNQLGWTRFGTYHPAIYQTSYPEFFEAWTNQCNGISFSPFTGGSPQLTNPLREKMNQLQEELNCFIAYWQVEINERYRAQTNGFSPIIYVDQDEDYTFHRFCENNIEEPALNNDNIYFFPMRYLPGTTQLTAQDFSSVNTDTCEADAGDDFGLLWVCGMAIALKNDPSLQISDEVPSALPEFLVKNFHPTIPGHKVVASAVSDSMSFNPQYNGQKFRIMAIGDSITEGYQSSDGNGYRKYLNDLLTAAGAQVEWVGPFTSGTAPQDHHLGVPGYTANQILGVTRQFLSGGEYNPNLILLMGGTNDVNQGSTGTFANTMRNLIEYLDETLPNVAILLGHIPKIGLNTGLGPLTNLQSTAMYYNGQLSSIVNEAANGYKMFYPGDLPIHVSKVHNQVDWANRADTLHPNDIGYEKMAHGWFERIWYIYKRGWIFDPGPEASDQPHRCNVKPLWFPNGEIANGAGLGKDAYPDVHCGDKEGSANTCTCGTGIDSDEGDDYDVPLTGQDCPSMSYSNIHAVHFADLDGDGRAEYLHIGDNGEVHAFYNLGAPGGEDAFNGSQVGWWDAGIIATGVGARRQEVQFADLNGDGRAEYLWVHANGSVSVWFNQGKVSGGKTPANVGWYAQGLVAGGIGQPGSRIQFADLNGDKRAEYLSIDDLGGVDVYLNLGPRAGTDPNGAQVGWLPQTKTATGVGGTRYDTFFGDMDGDGRADYLYLQDSGAVSVWRNGGAVDDGPHAGEPTWVDEGQVTGGDGTPGYRIEFADLNGDGRVEYLEVDPNTSAVVAYQNGCPEGDSD